MKLLKYIIGIFQKYQDAANYYRNLGVRIGQNTILESSVDLDTEPYLISIGSNSYISSNVRFVTHDGGYVLSDGNII